MQENLSLGKTTRRDVSVRNFNFEKRFLNINLHSDSRQTPVSCSSSSSWFEHSEIHDLVLDCSPLPQVTEQSDQEDHGSNDGPKIRNYFLIHKSM